MEETDRLSVGRIVGTHGIRGEVRVSTNTDFPERRFSPQTRLFLSHPSLDQPISVVVKKSRPHKHLQLVQFVGWERIEEVERFKDAELWIPLTEMAPQEELGEDEFYSHQIIGCSVMTTCGRELGTIREILTYPANDVWVVKPRGKGKEILLPSIKEVIKQVDLQAKVVTIEWMEGLEPS